MEDDIRVQVQFTAGFMSIRVSRCIGASKYVFVKCQPNVHIWLQLYWSAAWICLYIPTCAFVLFPIKPIVFDSIKQPSEEARFLYILRLLFFIIKSPIYVLKRFPGINGKKITTTKPQMTHWDCKYFAWFS